ncbi:MAG TPA: inositol monophosphatase family protein [bacterium]|nr:inositol monophosphatase family protein [bacterium]
MERHALLRTAEEIAREAGELLLESASRPLEVREKGATDLVTSADQASEELILKRIRAAYPDHRILSEESAGKIERISSGALWIVDPLDGTTNYAHGLPIWAVSIACCIDGETVAGVVLDPARRECFTALRGEGAYLNGRPIRVSSRERLQDALLVTGFPYDVHTSAIDNLDHFVNFMKRSRAVRRLGSAAIDLAYVACGRFDGFWELKLHPWDVAAGALIVEEAGGKVVNFDGSLFDPFSEEIVAANSKLLGPMAAILSQGKRPARAGAPS